MNNSAERLTASDLDPADFLLPGWERAIRAIQSLHTLTPDPHQPVAVVHNRHRRLLTGGRPAGPGLGPGPGRHRRARDVREPRVRWARSIRPTPRSSPSPRTMRAWPARRQTQ